MDADLILPTGASELEVALFVAQPPERYIAMLACNARFGGGIRYVYGNCVLAMVSVPGTNGADQKHYYRYVPDTISGYCDFCRIPIQNHPRFDGDTHHVCSPRREAR